MLSYDEAIEVLFDRIQPLPAVDHSLEEALGSVLAHPVEARWDLPPADNSAMDGYAFAFSDQQEGAELTVDGFVPAGESFAGTVSSGSAVKIMTGAPLPAGCDTVVPVEEVEEGEGRARLLKAPRAGQHVRRRGEEIRSGEVALEPGKRLGAGELSFLAACGMEEVGVHRRPRVAVLSTGDELVEVGQAPGPGQIVNSNAHYLAARLRQEGCAVEYLGIARDSRESLGEAIGRGLQADVLITTGGVSMGDRDLVQEVLQQYGFELGFWRLAIKPGKPVLFGTVKQTAVFGLPGNPAATAATFEILVRPALRRLCGDPNPLPPRLRVRLEASVQGGGKRQRFLWGTLAAEGGQYRFAPSDRQGSGQNRSLQGGLALLPVAAGSAGLSAGKEVEVLLLSLPKG